MEPPASNDLTEAQKELYSWIKGYLKNFQKHFGFVLEDNKRLRKIKTRETCATSS